MNNDEQIKTELKTIIDPLATQEAELSEILNKQIKKQKKASLKKEIKGLASQGTEIRKEIQTLSGRARYDAWDRKRKVGKVARHHLIAYGLLRGRDYHTQIEPNVREYVDWDYAFNQRVTAIHEILQRYCLESERGKWSKEHLKEILSCSRRGSKGSTPDHG